MAFREFFQWFDNTAMNLQLPTVTNKLYENEVTLSEQNLFLQTFPYVQLKYVIVSQSNANCLQIKRAEIKLKHS